MASQNDESVDFGIHANVLSAANASEPKACCRHCGNHGGRGHRA